MKKIKQSIQAVADSADFGPAYKGDDFITLTFRVPKDTKALAGLWELKSIGPGTCEWAADKCQEYKR